jgi:hypothetical protein
MFGVCLIKYDEITMLFVFILDCSWKRAKIWKSAKFEKWYEF